jgi:hypothetical protein
MALGQGFRIFGEVVSRARCLLVHAQPRMVPGVGFRVLGFWFRVGAGMMGDGLVFRASGIGFEVKDLEYGVWGSTEARSDQAQDRASSSLVESLALGVLRHVGSGIRVWVLWNRHHCGGSRWRFWGWGSGFGSEGSAVWGLGFGFCGCRVGVEGLALSVELRRGCLLRSRGCACGGMTRFRAKKE